MSQQGLKEIDKLLETLDLSVITFTDGLPAVQQKTFDKLLLLIKDLKTDVRGNIVNNVENIKKIQAIKKEVDNLILTKPYLNSCVKPKYMRTNKQTNIVITHESFCLFKLNLKNTLAIIYANISALILQTIVFPNEYIPPINDEFKYKRWSI